MNKENDSFSIDITRDIKNTNNLSENTIAFNLEFKTAVSASWVLHWRYTLLIVFGLIV